MLILQTLSVWYLMGIVLGTGNAVMTNTAPPFKELTGNRHLNTCILNPVKTEVISMVEWKHLREKESLLPVGWEGWEWLFRQDDS